MDTFRRATPNPPSLSEVSSTLSTLLSTPTPLHLSSTHFSSFLLSLDHLRSFPDPPPSLLRPSLSRLLSEFLSLLSPHSPSHLVPIEDDGDNNQIGIPVAAPVEDYNVLIDALPSSTIRDLNAAARRAAGFDQSASFAAAFAESRRLFVRESLSRLGFLNEFDLEAVSWPDLEVQIRRFNEAVKVCFLILFPSERRLCDRVFAADLNPIADLAFAESCHPAAETILSFADSVASTPARLPEKLFKMVDMYEVLRDLLPEIEYVFGDQLGEALVVDFAGCVAKLASAIRGILTEFENMILRDPVGQPVHGGPVHPITRYVVNYLRAAGAMWRTLEEVIEQEEEVVRGVTVMVDRLRQSSPLSAQIGWIMDHLNSNLEAKSKAYADEALRYVFLMNNGRYIVNKLGGSELEQLLGEQWVRGQMTRIGKWVGDYQRISWGKVIAVLRLDNDGIKGTVEIPRKKIKLFNAYLEDICKKQKGWVATDEWLREEIRLSAIGTVIPTYKSFLGHATREWGRQMEGHVKYTPQDVEDRIVELFDGSSAGRR